MEGVCRNTVIGGFESGSIRVWDAWDLSFLCELKDGHASPVTALTFSDDFSALFSGDATGHVLTWTVKRPSSSTNLISSLNRSTKSLLSSGGGSVREKKKKGKKEAENEDSQILGDV